MCVTACPVRGRGGRSETPTTSPNHCARSHSRDNQPIRREQGPGGGRGGAMPLKRALAVTEPQDETGRRKKEG